jgi:hypothetical protein
MADPMADRRERHPLRTGALLWPQKTSWPDVREAVPGAFDSVGGRWGDLLVLELEA